MYNRFVLNETSYHGAGAVKAVAEEITARGFKKAFVASDPDLIKFGVSKKVTDVLDDAGIAYEMFSEIKPNPTIQNVQSGVAAFKASGADCIVAIGGGSSMDTAKAIGIIIKNPEFADWLIAHGVDESRIYREDRSTSTQENFAYSEEIMAELGLDAGDTFAFVTNDYHIFRAGRIAGTDAACGVAATLPRSAYYDALQLNYYVREAFATGWLLLRGN